MIKGECKQCGSCCLYGGAFTYDVFEYPSGRIYSFRKVNKKKKRKIQPCQYLVYDIETRKPYCNTYDKRPGVCKQYPYKKEELIFKDCGYYWED